MKITPVTLAADASSPTHPDHARWVKEQTLKREIAFHGGLRAAETANMRNLERLANRKMRPAKPKKERKRKEITHEQLAASGVTKRIAPAKKLPPMPACKLCRKCVRCKRELRMSQIMTKGRQQEPKALALVQELVAIVLAAQARKDYKDALGRELPFSRLGDIDRLCAITQGTEWVCDRSVSFMGQWR